MNTKKKVLCAAIVCALGVVLLCLFPIGLGQHGGTVNQSSQTEDDRAREIDRALKLVRETFRRDFDGCTLTALWYDQEYSDQEAREWAEQYDAKEAIVLLSNFDVGETGADPSLEPGQTYSDWAWVLTRNSESEDWTLQTWGYG